MRRQLLLLLVVAATAVTARAGPISSPDSAESIAPASSEPLADASGRRQGRFLLLKYLAAKLFASSAAKKVATASAGTAATVGVVGGAEAGHEAGAEGGGEHGAEVVGVIHVPDPKPATQEFFATALKLPGLAVKSVVNKAQQTAHAVQSVASAVVSLPVKAGEALLNTVSSGLEAAAAAHEIAVGQQYVPEPVVYAETSQVQQPHHIIVPIVIKGLDHHAQAIASAGGALNGDGAVVIKH